MQSIIDLWHDWRKTFFSSTKQLHGEWLLLLGLISLISIGLIILYSAGNASLVFISRQTIHIILALICMLLLAKIPPTIYRMWAPWLFFLSLIILNSVLFIGTDSKGAQRWLDVWLFRFQPSELMKLTVPMMLAWYLHDKALPPSPTQLGVVISLIILAPALLVAKQPDLGTALLITMAGLSVIFLTGINSRYLLMGILLITIIVPISWYCMYDYQRDRIMSFLSPEQNPLGAGYHIIQSKITIGSGGIFGKGWLHGTQSHLQFLPENTTDFIFAVCSEEFGFLGAVSLIAIYLGVTYRSLYISLHATDTFSSLLASGLSLTFFITVFVNIAMVCGILPVVGIPLPLVSYGGTSMLTLMAGFGVLMSISKHSQWSNT